MAFIHALLAGVLQVKVIIGFIVSILKFRTELRVHVFPAPS
ncbi:MAG: hypothetical protein WCH65_06910 [bacterium]